MKKHIYGTWSMTDVIFLSKIKNINEWNDHFGNQMSLNFKQETGQLSYQVHLITFCLIPRKIWALLISASSFRHDLKNKQIKTNNKNTPNTKKLTKFLLGAMIGSSERILSLLWGKGKRNSIPLVQLFWVCLWNLGEIPTSTNPSKPYLSTHPTRVRVTHTSAIPKHQPSYTMQWILPKSTNWKDLSRSFISFSKINTYLSKIRTNKARIGQQNHRF